MHLKAVDHIYIYTEFGEKREEGKCRKNVGERRKEKCRLFK